jgi:hypothetical protein
MPKLQGAQTAATLLGALLAAGCSGEARTAEDSSASTPATQSSSSSPSSPTASTSPIPSRSAGGGSNCLFTVAQVSRVIAGAWERDPGGEEPCVYSSDLGGVVGTGTIDDDMEIGLRAVRENCVPGVKTIALAGGEFVCVQRLGSGDSVVGTLAARGHMWMVVINPESARPHEPEFSAMVSLVRAAPK